MKTPRRKMLETMLTAFGLLMTAASFTLAATLASQELTEQRPVTIIGGGLGVPSR